MKIFSDMDHVQIFSLVSAGVVTIVNSVVPYAVYESDGSYEFGFHSFFSILIIIHSLFISSHPFGIFEIYNFRKHAIINIIILFALMYIKMLFMSRNGFDLIWPVVVIQILVQLILLGVLYFDRIFYVVGRRDNLE